MPDVGFIKQQLVEITDEGVVRDTFPLTEEIESVEWMPGVIVLLPADQLEEIKNTGMILKNIPVFQINPSNILNQSSRIIDLLSSRILLRTSNNFSVSCGVKTAVGSSRISISAPL